MATGFFRGFLYPFKGAKFLVGHAKLWPLSVMPFLLTIVLYITGASAFAHYFPQILNSLLKPSGTWYGMILYYGLALILIIAFTLFVLITFTAVGCILASPFLESISEKVEILIAGKKPAENSGIKKTIQGVIQTITNEFKKWSLFFILQVIILSFNLLPVIGQFLYAITSVVITFHFFAIEYLDFIFSRKHQKFSDNHAFVKANLWSAWGFGAGISLTTLVPLLNFILLPAAVTGATMFYFDRIKPEKMNLGESSRT